MDRTRRRAALLFATLLCAACGPSDGASGSGTAADASATPADAPEARVQTADPATPPVVPGPGVSADEASVVARTAQPVAGALMQTLSTNLMAAVDEGGAVGAMEFCQVEALPLTRQVAAETGMQVKRTSWRLRNPDNAPDGLESAALLHFADAAASSDGVPAPWVQADPEGGYRFYRPLPTAPLCLNCHGAPDELAPGVADALARLYPRDEAVGFAEGELRGLLEVRVPAGAPAPEGAGAR